VEDVLLSVHVLAGIVFVGGSAVAASLFPRYAPVAAGADAGERSVPVALAMHRITRVYGVLGLIVPAVGIVPATVQGRMAEVWIGVAMALTAIAGGLLALQIYPRQRAALAEPGNGGALRRLGMLAGIYTLLWAAVVVLMIIRPGDNHPS
jgi:Na+/proline symporter